jgi:hypothetical protein
MVTGPNLLYPCGYHPPTAPPHGLPLPILSQKSQFSTRTELVRFNASQLGSVAQASSLPVTITCGVRLARTADVPSLARCLAFFCPKSIGHPQPST